MNNESGNEVALILHQHNTDIIISIDAYIS